MPILIERAIQYFFDGGVPETRTRRAKSLMPSASTPSTGCERLRTGVPRVSGISGISAGLYFFAFAASAAFSRAAKPGTRRITCFT